MDSPPYRGPPPRKDRVMSPSREREWHGNDLFNIKSEMNGEEKQTMKASRDYDSEYAKLAQNGGQNDLLHMMEENGESKNKQRGEDFSDYSKLARQGGHQGLLRMDGEQVSQEERRQKGCGEISDYSRLAREGGHKDLLVIEENQKTERVAHQARSGDWFEHNNNKSQQKQQPTPQPQPVERPVIVKPKQDRVDGCLPGGNAETQRCGKKRFNIPQSSGAPFATNY